MKNNSLYVKDSQTLRIGLCVYVVVVEVFQFLWRYAISPISKYCLDNFQDPLNVIGTFILFVYIVSFIVCCCFRLEKGWKWYYVSFSVYSIIDFIRIIISQYNYYSSLPIREGDVYNPLSSMISIFIIYFIELIVPAIISLLMLTKKKPIKYIFIVIQIIFILISLFNVFSHIQEVLTLDETFGWSHINGHLLSESERPFMYIALAIDSIPTFTVAYLFITFFIGFKKKPKATSIQANSYAYDMSYQPNAYPTTYAPEYFYNNSPYTPPEVKYCPMCGNQANLSDFFCGKCGHAFNMQ